MNPSSSPYLDDVKEEQNPKVLYAPTIENPFSFSKLDDVKEVENTGMTILFIIIGIVALVLLILFAFCIMRKYNSHQL